MLHVIILDAGRGRRLIPLTNSKPKCLLKISGSTILEHQINLFDNVSGCRFTICVGYKKKLIEKELNKIGSKIPLNYVTVLNSQYDVTNTLYSLQISIKDLTSGFLVLNGDVVIDKAIFTQFLQKINSGKSLLLAQFKKADMEAVRISLDKNGFVQEISKKVSGNKSIGEYTGIGYFSDHDSKYLVKSLYDGVHKDLKMEYYEWAVQNMIHRYDTQVAVLNTGKYNFVEIDTIQDYKKAKRKFE